MYLETFETIRKAIATATGRENPPLTDGGAHADFASTVAFDLAKERKKSPVQIAAEIAETLLQDPALRNIRVSTTGPYINFNTGGDFIRQTLSRAIRPGYGNLPAQPVRIVLEHTSANPNGPLHVGHIRNTIIGDTLARSFRKAGHPVEVQYYVNDMGRQIAIVVWGFTHLDSAPREGEKGDHHVARVYIAANREIERDPGIVAGVDRFMQKVEEGDAETVSLFRTAVSECLDGFRETLARLNARHDRFVWESDFIRNGDTSRVIARLKQQEECHEDGRLWIDLSAAGFEKEYVLRRSDGTTVYAARDLAYHIWKGRNFDRVIDVLGADHKLIGSQLIATLKLLGEQPPEIVHFEFVSLPEGAMSTRAGKFVSADELIDEVTRRAYDEVTARRDDLDEGARRAIARSVAIAAIRYDIVKISPEKSTVFDWEEALDFERQSGPYIQYAHARACSILGKAGDFEPAFSLSMESEIALAKHIAKFPWVLTNSVRDLRPHLIATYARELADLFNVFYQFEPVLKSEGEIRNSRLTLVLATKNTLREALETLGIDALATM
ncbi:MAG: arginine--tRNA ligase [Methanomicrobiales archaeon]|nr:arginine--tRNA ligase [Methanomicrobiales archaeon]